MKGNLYAKMLVKREFNLFESILEWLVLLRLHRVIGSFVVTLGIQLELFPTATNGERPI